MKVEEELALEKPNSKFDFHVISHKPAASNIATADVLKLLLQSQRAHAQAAAAEEEVKKWLSENGIHSVADSALVAMETLDTNAQAISDVVTLLRKL